MSFHTQILNREPTRPPERIESQCPSKNDNLDGFDYDRQEPKPHTNLFWAQEPMQRLLILLLFLLPIMARANGIEPRPLSHTQDPCAGPSGLLAELDRPTVGDSACVVRSGRAIIEMGYAHADTRQGTSANGPQSELRFGLTHHNEFVLLPPNATYQNANGIKNSSYSATVFGLKHEWGYTRRWLYSGEILLTAPTSGTLSQPSDGWGEAANVIVGYNITPTVAAGFMFGISTLYSPSGQRYVSANPDFTATWLLDPRWQLYGEIYGQSHTGYGIGGGWDADGGLQYLVHRHIEIDIEAGQRLSGALGGYRNYWGLGAGWEF